MGREPATDPRYALGGPHGGVWPDVVVEDGGLMVCITGLRRELGDEPRTPRFIVTPTRWAERPTQA
jgi:hypothetical protein